MFAWQESTESGLIKMYIRLSFSLLMTKQNPLLSLIIDEVAVRYSDKAVIEAVSPISAGLKYETRNSCCNFNQ
jgi:hypothetical protein